MKGFAALNVLVFCLGTILLQLNSHLLLGKNNLMLSASFHCPGNIRCPLGHPRPPRSTSLLHTGILIYSFFSQLICKYQQGQHLEEPVHILATARVPQTAAAACSDVLVVIMCSGMPSLTPRGLQHMWGHLPFFLHGLGPAQRSDQRQMLPPPPGAPRHCFARTGSCIPSSTHHPGASFPPCCCQQSWSQLHSTRTSGKLT